MWRDLERPPLNQQRLRRALLESRWRQIHVLSEVGSTQEEALSRRGDGDLVVIAEHQTSGRGRQERSWVSPRQAGITMSLLFEGVAPSPWIGTMVSMAAVDAVNEFGQVSAELKWPNDLIINGKKFGGVISEVHGDAVVVGIGINVSTQAFELPVEGATSLLLEGVRVDREPLIKEILRNVKYPLADNLRERYLSMLGTIGKEVRIFTPDGEVLGRASDVDSGGNLVLESGVSFSVGDVVHVR